MRLDCLCIITSSIISFDKNVNQITYLIILQTCVFTEELERALEAVTNLQKDSTPAHFALLVRKYLDDKFSGR
jgi:hypothetical protein